MPKQESNQPGKTGSQQPRQGEEKKKQTGMGGKPQQEQQGGQRKPR